MKNKEMTDKLQQSFYDGLKKIEQSKGKEKFNSELAAMMDDEESELHQRHSQN